MKLNKVLVSAAAISGIAAAGTAANADTVSVKSGDTVSELAEKYNTTVEAIKDANNLQNVDLITIGQELTIPGTDVQSQQTQTQTANTAAQQEAAAQQAAAQKQAEQEAAAQQAQQEAAQKQAQQEAAQKQAQQEAAQKQAQQEAAAQRAQQQTTSTQTNSSSTSSSNTASSSSNSSSSSLSSSEESARAWIVARESGGNYSARNGQYVGAYQLTDSYLNGDYSQANQDKVANEYVASRYGSWANAQTHWENFGWY